MSCSTRAHGGNDCYFIPLVDHYRLIFEIHILEVYGDGCAIQDSMRDARVFLLEGREELSKLQRCG